MRSFCRACLTGWLSTGGGRTQCPLRCLSKVERVTPNRYAKEAIDHLKVRCPNLSASALCIWGGELQQLEAHTKICSFQEVSCKLPGCTAKMRRVELPEHAAACAARVLPCIHCALELGVGDVVQHQSRCPAAPITCPNSGCGLALAQRYMLEEHRLTCEHELVTCPVASCGERRIRSLFDAHLQQAPVAHHRALVAQVTALTKQLAAAEELLHGRQGSLHTSEADLEGYRRGEPRMRHD